MKMQKIVKECIYMYLFVPIYAEYIYLRGLCNVKNQWKKEICQGILVDLDQSKTQWGDNNGAEAGGKSGI